MGINQEIATQYFAEGFNCAQAIVAVYSEKYGLNKDTALKLSGGMGGGFRSGEICGAVSGAVLVVGLKYGQYIAGDMESKANCAKKTREVIDAFKAQNGCLVCRDLLGCDTSTSEGQDYFKNNNLSKKICIGLIESSVTILDKLGY